MVPRGLVSANTQGSLDKAWGLCYDGELNIKAIGPATIYALAA